MCHLAEHFQYYVGAVFGMLEGHQMARTLHHRVAGVWHTARELVMQLADPSSTRSFGIGTNHVRGGRAAR